MYLTNINSSLLEPKRKNRWVLQFSNIDILDNVGEKLAFAAYSGARPSISYEETEMHRLNERFYVAGKPSWETLSFEFYDYIDSNSASKILWDWSNSIYNPLTGAMNSKKSYSSIVTLGLLNPAGGIVESWNLYYAWPQAVNWNDLDASSSDIVNVSLTLRFDFAIRGTTANDSAEDSGSGAIPDNSQNSSITNPNNI